MSKPQPFLPRAAALDLLEAVLDRRQTFDEALVGKGWPVETPDGRFALLLTRTVLRHLGQIDALITGYLETPLPAKRQRVMHALRLGVAQLYFLETPAHAAVNETVTLLKRGKDKGLAGLVNAVLQKISREKPALGSVEFNIPAWMKARWRTQYGKPQTAMMAQVAAERPPLDLISQTPREGVRMDSFIVRLPAQHEAVEALPGYEQGAFFVQDLAANYPVRLLGDVRGKRVLDLCAAPGGKTLQLALAGAQVSALDRSPTRMERVQENLARMRCEAECIVADALEWEPTDPYDAILLDAPCSATGTWRRHPEVVQLVTLENIAELATLQRQLLQRAWEWVKPGGMLVYCVCSLEPEEGEAQAEWFLAHQPEAKFVPAATTLEIEPAAITSQGYLRTLPCYRAEQGGMDGFFAASFRKQA